MRSLASPGMLDGVHIHSCGHGGLWFRLTATHFFQTPKSKQKRLPLRTAFAALRFPRSGVHQGIALRLASLQPAPCATYRSALNPVAAAELARLRSAAKRTQGLETAGGPSVLSQPAAAATGVVSVSSCMELSESEVLPDRAAGSRSKAAPCATYRSALIPVAAAEPARLRSTAQQAQGLEPAGGPSVLSQPAAAATGIAVISALFVGASLLAIRFCG